MAISHIINTTKAYIDDNGIWVGSLDTSLATQTSKRHGKTTRILLLKLDMLCLIYKSQRVVASLIKRMLQCSL